MKRLTTLPKQNVDFFDAGARGGANYPFSEYEKNVNCYLFEPDPEEFKRMNLTKPPTTTMFQCGLSALDTDAPLYLTKSRGCSSLYEPNLELLRNFPNSDRFGVERVEKVSTMSLDTLTSKEGLKNIDFIKIDVQGAELDIVKGGLKFLKPNLIGLEAEVEFLELYKGQPLFSDLDQFVKHEFDFWLIDLKKYYWKFKPTSYVGTRKGVLAFGDALYLKSPLGLLDWCEKHTKSLHKLEAALFIAAIYGYPDYCFKVLEDTRSINILGTTSHRQWLHAVETLDRTFLPSFMQNFLGIGSAIQAVAKLFQPNYQNWATTDGNLGAKNRAGWWE